MQQLQMLTIILLSVLIVMSMFVVMQSNKAEQACIYFNKQLQEKGCGYFFCTKLNYTNFTQYNQTGGIK